MDDEMYNFTTSIFTKPICIQQRCMAKISFDDGKTWWPRGSYEIHVAGNIYVLMMNGSYERRS